MLPFYVSTSCNSTHIKLTAYMCTWLVCACLMDALYLAIIQIFMITLVIYGAHFHMDPAWLVALVWNYFEHHDYLVVHCLIQATLLHPTIITLVGAPNIWRYMSNGVSCYHILVILHSLFPHVSTIFPLPWVIFGIMLISIDTTYILVVSEYLAAPVFPWGTASGPAAYPPWPGLDYPWSTNMLNL